MNKSKNSAAKASLLTDSLSSDSDIVPDLELIPPARPKKKLRFKRVAAKFSMPNNNADNEFVPEYTLPRAWIACASLVMMSLVLGLAVTSWFTVTLYRELETVLSNNSDTVRELQRRLQLLEASHDSVMIKSPTNDAQQQTQKPVALFGNVEAQENDNLQSIVRLNKSLELLNNDMQNVQVHLQHISESSFANFSVFQFEGQLLLMEHNLNTTLDELAMLRNAVECTRVQCCTSALSNCVANKSAFTFPNASTSSPITQPRSVNESSVEASKPRRRPPPSAPNV